MNSKNHNYVIFYHGKCYDGVTSAWLMQKWLEWPYPIVEKSNISAYPVEYGKPIPYVDDDSTLYILDVAIPLDKIKSMLDRNIVISVIDHHKTNEAILDKFNHENLCKTFDMNRSAAMMCYDYIASAIVAFEMETDDVFGGSGYIDVEKKVRYIQDNDLWKFELPDSKQINAGIQLYKPYTFRIEEMMKVSIDELSDIGKSLLCYKNSIIDRLLETRMRVSFLGYQVDVVNCPIEFRSEVCNILLEIGNPFGLAYSDEWNGRHFSLRSDNKHVDVSEIAERCGGGGHRNAAAFIEQHPFNLITVLNVE